MQITASSFILGFLLFFWTGFPPSFSDSIRTSFTSVFFAFQKKPALHTDESKIRLENHQLKEHLRLLQDIREGEERKIHPLNAVPAQVIYRDPTSWSSTIWVNIGEDENLKRGKPLIAINSPVVDGDALVGVIDYVGKTQSRVRLITDSGLSPAVRAVRGGRQEREINHLITLLKSRLAFRNEFAGERKALSSIQEKLKLDGEDFYLAKGELKGSSLPFWKSKSPLLKGTGFNCDFPDALSPAAELTSKRPIIQKGDLLITSGLDGVFPAGLSVAIVEKVFPLPEGGYAYDLEAKPAASYLNDLSIVFILPPLSSD
jgi:cell shape-determining protein MreC